jgi:hypothetical protein
MSKDGASQVDTDMIERLTLALVDGKSKCHAHRKLPAAKLAGCGDGV